MRAAIFLFFILVLVSCSYYSGEMIGTYSPDNYTNTYDTIQLGTNNIYYRRVYDRNKKLVLKTKGKWKVDHDLIVFEPPYFLNLDRDLVKFPELLNDTISNGIGYIGVNSGRIEFCVGHFSADIPNQNCYKRVADE
ncbi:hypothetical protein [Sphingobacterium sp. 2149]|uniref:hypothetical protein n=1 Tax=Sphingobacterium sp. 2149 TaxID=2817763 RepID=UPI0028574B44|nr:hypothetical protein [Sphingobacterium sp. 2149]MDR6735215.1 hypothetical protein [Sphingobacterium sp. 2149]